MRPTIRMAAATVAAIVAACLVLPGLRANLIAMTRNLAIVASMMAAKRDAYAAPQAGEAVLPLKVQVGLKLVRDAKLPDFRLTPSWHDDPLLAQRMTEAAWPIPSREASHNVVGRAEEMPPACTIVDGYTLAEDPGYAVAAARCP